MAIFIPEDKVLEIKNAADIVDIISEVVHLKKSGKNFLGLCPFHSEKTPSFSVSPEKQIFYCFGCGVGGNIFSFLMKHDGLAFPEAARTLARRYGVDIPNKSLTVEQKKRITEREGFKWNEAFQILLLAKSANLKLLLKICHNFMHLRPPRTRNR